MFDRKYFFNRLIKKYCNVSYCHDFIINHINNQFFDNSYCCKNIYKYILLGSDHACKFQELIKLLFVLKN